MRIGWAINHIIIISFIFHEIGRSSKRCEPTWFWFCQKWYVMFIGSSHILILQPPFTSPYFVLAGNVTFFDCICHLFHNIFCHCQKPCIHRNLLLKRYPNTSPKSNPYTFYWLHFDHAEIWRYHQPCIEEATERVCFSLSFWQPMNPVLQALSAPRFTIAFSSGFFCATESSFLTDSFYNQSFLWDIAH